MNEIAGYARPVPQGFWAMIRLHRDGKPKPVMAKGGAPLVYATEAEALRAVVAHICSYVNSPITSTGMKMQRFAAADALFRKGRKIEIEKRRISE